MKGRLSQKKGRLLLDRVWILKRQMSQEDVAVVRKSRDASLKVAGGGAPCSRSAWIPKRRGPSVNDRTRRLEKE